MNQGFEKSTAGIRVRVKVFYLDDQSRPGDGYFVWAYRVTISNEGPVTVQLLRRSWRITDAFGRVQTVQGEGVIGEQPVLEPGESFEYTSGTPLQAPSGFMTGQYHMITSHAREAFDIDIPTFSLDSPHQNSQVH